MVGILGGNPPLEGFPEARKKIRILLLDLVLGLVVRKVPVVFDDGFWERDYRDLV